jgi:K+-sensing histidine kinase KdpD
MKQRVKLTRDLSRKGWNKFRAFLHHKEEGMGLGLSVCGTIIAAHRGKLWATNNADRGATFHFSLPIGKSDEEAVITNKRKGS